MGVQPAQHALGGIDGVRINAGVDRGNGINRTLSDPEQKTAALIREDLKQARAALDSGDVDGARTLVAKARVLLAELSQ